MTSYRFFKMAASSHVGFCVGIIRPSTKCICRSPFGPQVDRIYSFGDIAILKFWHFELPVFTFAHVQ